MIRRPSRTSLLLYPKRKRHRDYATSGFDVLQSAANDAPKHPRTRLIAPDGSVAKEWQDFAGPAEIGLAVRRALGAPIYFQMDSDN
jgi:hypothetical protein